MEVSTEELNEAIAQDKITILAAPQQREGDADANADVVHNTPQRDSHHSATDESVDGSRASNHQHREDDSGSGGAKTLVRIFNSDFRTAGHVIAIITVFTISLQLAILFSLYSM